MRHTRRAFLGAAALAAASCNRDNKKVIGMVPMGRSHQYWQSVHAGAVKAARELNVSISWNGPLNESDFNGQVQIVEAMINRHVDAIALAPIEKKVMAGPVEKATKQGIPVVIFDSPVGTDAFISQIATDNYAAGQLAAERMGKVLNGKGKVVIVAVQVGSASTMAREAGFEDKIKKDYPGIQIVDKRYGEADFAKSLQIAENMLTGNPDLDGMFASNESSTVGAAQALKGRGATKVRLVGFDSGPSLETDLRNGVIDSLVVQNPFKMGYESVTAAVRKLKGEPVQKINNLEARLVLKDDLDRADVKEQLNPDVKKWLEGE